MNPARFLSKGTNLITDLDFTIPGYCIALSPNSCLDLTSHSSLVNYVHVNKVCVRV